MKTYNIFVILLICISFNSCYLIKISENEVVVIGTIEHDYSQLKNKNIDGIGMILGTDKPYSKFRLQNKPKQNDLEKDLDFIRVIGPKGNYELFYYIENKVNKDKDYILSKQEQEIIEGYPHKQVVEKFNFSDKKIVNLGKIIVEYTGGTQQIYGNWGGINYNYNFNAKSKDTTALHLFKKQYPKIYEQNKNNIYTFKSEFEQALEYVLNNISEGKRLFLIQYIEENPNSAKNIFANINEETQKELATKIEKFTFEELKKFLEAE